jgi:hypothetical protein
MILLLNDIATFHPFDHQDAIIRHDGSSPGGGSFERIR